MNDYLQEISKYIIVYIHNFNLLGQVKDLIKQSSQPQQALDILRAESMTITESFHLLINL